MELSLSLVVVKGRKTALVQQGVYVHPDTGRGLGGAQEHFL